MTTTEKLTRFLDAQNQLYLKALSEVKNGRKESHWMWFIFPQIIGLGQSETSKFYAIMNLAEANEYLAHPVLGKHLIEITSAMLEIKDKTVTSIFGTPDDLKFHSCMTLFANIENTNTIFQEAINRYFDGQHDKLTLEKINNTAPQ